MNSMLLLKKYFALALLLPLLACSPGETGNPGNNDGNDKDKDDKTESLIGKVLPDWEEGYLDIHAINTGRGESTLLIFPDGTTMLVDAAASLIDPNHEIPPPAQKPNAN